jgi:hypothetical protein
MQAMRQKDLFDQDPRQELFDEDRAPVLYRADPEKVRRELQSLLAQARAAEKLPWSREDLRYHQTVFPQMSRWLPEAEAGQLCFEFAREVERLLAA